MTRVVDNVIIARSEFFSHPLARLVVLESRIAKLEGRFTLERRGVPAIFVALGQNERAAPGWLFLGDMSVKLEGNALPEVSRFIEPAWPRRSRGCFGAAGGSGGVRRSKPDLSGVLKILCLATEWSSRNGGLSSVNRELCIALASVGHDVVCLVPPGTIDDGERVCASRAQVRLLEAPTTTGKDVGPLACLQRKPQLPYGFIPDVVIGHGRVTGFAAQTLVQDFFRGALHIHVIHTQPGEIEWYKARDTDGSRRVENSEIEETVLARAASLVVGVGPRLKRQADMYLHPHIERPPTFELNPGIKGADSMMHSPPDVECLFIGRAEDEHLKGLDIAAEAVRYARARGQCVRLIVRGAESGAGSDLQDRLSTRVGALNSVKVYGFNPCKDAVQASYLQASVVLMPSRTEGFGLVGLEAIGLGVPTLISDQSGLAELLTRELPEFASEVVVPIALDDQKNYQEWGSRILQVLKNRDVAFARAVELRLALSKRHTWEAGATGLVDAIRGLSCRTNG